MNSEGRPGKGQKADVGVVNQTAMGSAFKRKGPVWDGERKQGGQSEKNRILFDDRGVVNQDQTWGL